MNKELITSNTMQRIRVENAAMHLGRRAKDKVLGAKNVVSQKLALVGCAARGFATGIRK